MDTRDRIKRLLDHYQIWHPELPTEGLHEYLNKLDRAANISTGGGERKHPFNDTFIPQAYVGQRLRQHEVHAFKEHPEYVAYSFWLGDEQFEITEKAANYLASSAKSCTC